MAKGCFSIMEKHKKETLLRFFSTINLRNKFFNNLYGKGLFQICQTTQFTRVKFKDVAFQVGRNNKFYVGKLFNQSQTINAVHKNVNNCHVRGVVGQKVYGLARLAINYIKLLTLKTLVLIKNYHFFHM